MELLTAARMRAIEQAAIASGRVTGLGLMERAGAGVVDAVFRRFAGLDRAPRRAALLCGPGNNGGDGFVVARLLKARGWDIEVLLYGRPDKLTADARTNLSRLSGIAPVRPLTPANLPSPGFDLWFDALLGTGLSRRVDGDLADILGEMDDRWHWFHDKGVAIDLPSGLCADSGRALGPVMPAALTVTFHCRKLGHVLAEGPRLCREVVTVDIGLPVVAPAAEPSFSRIEARRESPVTLVGPASAAKRTGDHKYAHGHALILSGPATRTGAARLAARGALRVGAGLVTLGAPEGALAECAAQLTAIMLRRVDDGAGLTAALQDRRINALCLGPGLGLDDRATGFVAAALGNPVPGLSRDRWPGPAAAEGGGPGSSPGRGLVLDADALTILSRAPDLFAALHGGCVLTPHGGEFARLFPDIAARLDAPAARGPAFSKVDATREAAARAGCTVLFKGHDTVIADPTGRCAVNASVHDRAAPWLATAGSGDVLAGFIAGLLSRGLAPFDAACSAAWLHTECALTFGPGLIAEDLPEQVPVVFRNLGL